MDRRRGDKNQEVTNSKGPLVISVLVAIYGAYIIADTLFNQVLTKHHHSHINELLIDIPLLLGISLIYLSTLLRRHKQTAWYVTFLAFTFYLGIGISEILSNYSHGHRFWMIVLRSILLPIVLLLLLFSYQEDFVVKSDVTSWRSSLKIIAIIVVVTFMYGVVGFTLMDTSDFHQEISWTQAAHYTVDQFDLTVSKPVKPYTRRAKLFVDSLTFISVIATVYVVVSLFQPLRQRFSDQTAQRERMLLILDRYKARSEEFFKLWPHDKHYYFNEDDSAAIAYNVYMGTALILSDPVGDQAKFLGLLNSFNNECFYNDWQPALVHVSEELKDIYEAAGFTMQKLGQEAIVDLAHFDSEVKNDKYFRNIMNRFKKNDYSFELLSPPHHQAVIDRLKLISDDWLSKGSRSERGFAMGYFTEHYIQICNIAVARDAAGTIQAFMNLVPATFDKEESTYDMLRQSSQALSNITDYLMVSLSAELFKNGYKRLNLGLSPLSGLNEDDKSEATSLVGQVLKFAYSNGDRFFSFSGLYRFKSKYQPSWEDKYFGYKGGLRGFSKSITALTRCMSAVAKKKN